MSGNNLLEMMALIGKVEAAGAKISFANDELQIQVLKKKKLTDDLLNELRTNKEQLTAYFKNHGSYEIKPGNAIRRYERSVNGRIPLSHNQERLWFIDQLEGSSVQYHMSAVIKLSGSPEINALQYGFQQIVNRHEVLRTVIKQENGKAYQHIHTAVDWKLQIIEGDKYRDNDPGLKECVAALLNQPFDLSDDLMLRSFLIKLSEQEFILLIVLHHIAADGWSVSTIVKELVECYTAYTGKREARLSPLPLQYADFSLWQQEYLAGPVLKADMAYWKEKLEGTEPVILPTDFPRPAVQSTRGTFLKFRLDKALVDELQHLSREHGSTLFMTLLAAFKALLFRYSRQNDICIGTAIANRRQWEVEGLVGLFVNTLALRSMVDEEMTFTELLKQVRETTLSAYEHQDAPFDKVVETVVKHRDMSRNPLVQAMFVLQNTPTVPELRLGDLVLSEMPVEDLTSKFDLLFALTESGTGIQGIMEYCTDLFTADTIIRMLKHYEALLYAIVKNPLEKIRTLQLVTEQDHLQLLSAIKHTDTSYPRTKTIIDLFHDQAAATPDHVALVYGGKQLTYRELDQLSNQLGHYLVRKGVKEETLVPICMRHSLEMVIGMLGILKAGGAYVPIDPDYPADRISFMLEDTGTNLILSDNAGAASILLKDAVTVILLDAEWQDIIKQPLTPVTTAISADTAAYVIYTSGSTGKPKGVIVEHKNVVRLFKTDAPLYDFTDADVWTMFHSSSFDFSVWEIYGALFFGGKLIIIPKEISRDSLQFGKLLSDEGVTVLNQTPGAFYALQEVMSNAWPQLKVRYVIFGGEALNPVLLKPWKKQYPDCRLINMYGITETTVHVTYKELTKKDIQIGLSNIGKPIPTLECYILDENRGLVPAGVAGEIYVGGAGVSRGYLNQPELTAARFIKNPYGTGRLYRTGDLGKLMADGNIEYLGRIDTQVKIRGYRIELGEIEQALYNTGIVSQAVVLTKKDNQTNKLISYYVPDQHTIQIKERELVQNQLDAWKSVYEDEYGQAGKLPETEEEFNITGWNDSFTGGAIPAIEMQEWLDDIITVILSESPGRVLEIGCGTGLIYYRIAGHIKRYTGIDLSKSCIDQIEARILKKQRTYPETTLMVGPADKLEISADEEIDTVILNSVIQYFPSKEYLTGILDKSIKLLNGKGKIILGDVRDNRLLKYFVSRIVLNTLQEDQSVKDFLWNVDSGMLNEPELCISPEYFYTLPQRYPDITQVEIQWKQSEYLNELSLYRYTVVIYVNIQKEVIKPEWLSWEATGTPELAVNQIDQQTALIAIRNVPNPRLWKERLIEQGINNKKVVNVASLKDYIEKPDRDSEAVNEIIRTATLKGYRCQMFLSQDPLKVNLLLKQGNGTSFFTEQLYGSIHPGVNVANIPLFRDIQLLIEKDIQQLLAAQLPDYMIPSDFNALLSLPLTGSGKVDKKLLAYMYEQMQHTHNTEYVSPVLEREQVLINVCEEVLRRHPVGMLDDFFVLGGDSIKSIQVVSRLRQQGYYLSVKDVLMYPQLKMLSERMRRSEREISQDIVTGTVRQGAIQYAFFNSGYKYPGHNNQAVMLESRKPLSEECLSAMLSKIVAHHDALRMVYRQTDHGIWEQENPGLEQGYALYTYDLRGLADWETVMHVACEKIQSGIDLYTGPLLQAGLFHCDDVSRILLVIHHLVVDGVSWRILFEDLTILLEQYDRGSLLQLPAKSDSFQYWQQQVYEYSRSRELKNEHTYWATIENRETANLPLDMPGGSNLYKDERNEHYVLSPELTALLQGACHQAYGTDINDILLASLGLSFYEVFGIEELLLRLEGHGREAVSGEVDVTRTVGWFTSEYPVLLEMGEMSKEDALSYIVEVKEQLHRVPNKGMGYGILRYISDSDIREGMEYTKKPEVTFNYFGDFGTGIESREGESYFTYSKYSTGSTVNDEEIRDDLLSVQGMLAGGRLRITISYSASQFMQSTIVSLLNSYGQHLEQLIMRLSREEGRYKTPVDLTYQGLSIAELAALNSSGMVEDVYELTPLQQGMYYHWLSAPESPAYFEQIVYHIVGELDQSSLEYGYKQVVARHSVLRTSFTGQYGQFPLQVVHKGVQPVFTYIDASDDPDFDLVTYAASDRRQGFNLEEGSQMRLTVLRTGMREYTFVWSHHHILMDGWCTGIIIREFYQLYYSHRQGLSPDMPAVTPYREYIRWLRGVDRQESLRYWIDYIRDYDTSASITSNNTSLQGDTEKRHAETEVVIDAVIMKRLRKLCAELGITENSFVQTVWGILLSRYNNTKDVVFGGVVSGRPAELDAVEDMVGLFINTVPIRIQYETSTTISGLLQQVQQSNINGLPHHHVQLAEIQANSSLGRNLIDHILVFENYPVQDMVKKGLEERFELQIRGTDFFGNNIYNLTILVVSEEEMSIQLKYDTRLYTAAFINRLATNLRNTFLYALDHSTELVTDTEYLSEQEQNELLSFRQMQYSDDIAENVVERFERLAEEIPDNPAVISPEGKLTYQELNQLSNQLSDFLIQNYGIGKNDFVGIKLDRHEKWLIAGILATLKSGAAFLPLDADTDNARFSFIIEDCNCKVIIDNTLINEFKKFHTGYSAENALKIIEGSDTCYIIYTSGTTGKPKGVLVNHKALLNYLQAIADISSIGTGDSSVITSSYAFDLIYTSLLGSIFNGAAIHLISDEMAKNPPLLIDYIVKKEITYLKVTPTLFNLLVNYSDVNKLLGASSLRLIFLGGEPPVLPNIRLIRQYPKVRLFNHYGPTETTIGACVHEITDDNLPAFLLRPVIGKPLPNNYIYILDKDYRMLPVGATGEICIGGVGLSHGYWGREELTKQKFIQDPWRPEQQIYCTGDLGCRLEDGSIVFSGRIDNQVKIRGYRVEPGEIETALRESEMVEDAIVLTYKDEEHKHELVAYWTGNPVVTPLSLRTALRQRLPSYMIPSYFVHMERFPLTGNGKLDRSSLPTPKESELYSEEYVSPVLEREQVLINVCEEVLRRHPVGMLDDFFVLGGDSIKSIQVVSRLRQQGYYLSVKDVLMYPQLKMLSERMRRSEREISQDIVTGTVRQGAIQYAFFNSGYKYPGHNNQAVMLESRKPLSEECLSAMLSKIVAHHDALRMVYRQTDHGIWEQENSGLEQGYALYTYDLRGLADWETVMHVACEKIQSGIDLYTGPLLQAGLFHCDDVSRILLVIHHLVVDGVSWRILFEDLTILLEQYDRGSLLQLPAKSDSFQYWQQQVYEYSRSKELKNEHTYWATIENRKTANLPLDMPGGSNLYKDERNEHYVLSPELTALLQGACHQAYGTDINDILLASLGLSFYEVFGIEELLLQLEGHGREAIGKEIDVTRTVGWFTSKYPVLLEMGEMSKEDALSYVVEVKEQLHRVPNKGIGYGILRYISDNDIREGMTYTKKPEVIFNYLGDFGTGIESREGESYFTYSKYGTGSTVNDEEIRDDLLSVQGMLAGGRLRITISYSASQFMQSTIVSLLNSYGQHLEQLIMRLSREEGRYKTPVDLTYQGLSIAELAALNSSGMVEDVYELTPLQQGMYYHWLSAPESPAYFEQIVYELTGELDIKALEASYYYIIARHAILRTSFTHDYGLPLQVVRKSISEGFVYRDVRQERDFSVTAFAIADRSLGFDLGGSSQMRLTVLRTGEEEYSFIWSNHHIIMDGWCNGIIINEFYQAYSSFRKGTTPTLGTVYPYSSYIRWLSQVDLNASLQYWKNYLSGYSDSAGLPALAMSRQEATKQMRQTSMILSQHETDAIRQLCQELGVTENSFFQAVWGILLNKYNNTKDAVFGGVVSGRPAELEGVETMIGLFINTVPVRITYDATTTVSGLLKAIHLNNIDGINHHYIQLAEIQSQHELGQQLYNSIFIFENYPIEEMVVAAATGGEKETPLKVISAEAFAETNYDLNVIILPGAQMQVNFLHNIAMYATTFIERMVVHFKELISNMISSPMQKVAILPYIGNAEKKQLWYHSNGEKTDYPVNRTLPELFIAQTEKRFASTAVVFQDNSFTYEALNRLSGNLAYYLLEHCNVKPGDLIGIKLKRSEWAIISILGIMKAACAYVPIDLAYPKDRIDYIEQDSGCSLFLDEAFISRFEVWSELHPDLVRVVKARPSDLAYVLYTSGSTGMPKGVMIEHRSVINTLVNIYTIVGVEEDDKGLMFSSLSFDSSIAEIFMILLVGATLHIVNEDVKNDPVKLKNYIRHHQITVASIPPVYLKIMDLEKEDGLRKLISMGEAAVKSTAQKFSRFGRFFNGYGPTEASIAVSMHNIDAKSITDKLEIIPIGKAFRNTEMILLDDSLQLVPVGIIGEICIGGAGLSRGYLNRPDLTAEKFIPHPFKTGERLYLTGDLGRRKEDGNVEFIGRKDDQVKLRGLRIELGEIETILCSHENITDAIVVLKKPDAGEPYLAAYIVNPATEKRITIQGIRNHLSAKLPTYMVPTAYVIMDSFPLTPNGKTDRKALPEPQEGALATDMRYVAPRTEPERLLIEVCEDVLLHNNISMLDDFFVLGGDSIKSIQLVSRMRQWGYHLQVGDVLNYPLLEDMALRIKKGIRSIPQGTIKGEILPGPIQIAYLQSNQPDIHHYNQSVLLSSTERLDMAALQSILSVIVSHHDALRMVFTYEQERWHQHNLGLEQMYGLTVKELRDSTDWRQELEQDCSAIQSGFSLSRGPLLHAGLFQCPDGDRLLLAAHHLVVDGVSWRILLEDIGTLYKQYLDGQPLKLPQKTDSFQYWMEQQRRYASTPALLSEIPYWESITGLSLPPFPVEDASGSNCYADEATVSFRLDKERTYLLQTRCYQAYRTLINDILLTALGLSVKEVLKTDRFIVQLEGHGREHIGTEVDITRTVGWFTSVYPVLLDVTGEDTAVNHLIRNKEHLHRVPNKGIGYGILKYLTPASLRGDIAYNEIPAISFNYLGDFNGGAGNNHENNQLFKFSGEAQGSAVSDHQHRQNLLSVSGIIVNEELRVSISYSNKQYSSTTIENLLEAYNKALKGLITDLLDAETRLTPIDLTYSELRIDQLATFNNHTDIEDIYPLTAFQQDLYRFWKHERAPQVYFLQLTYQLKGNLNKELLKRSYDYVISRHANLRTSFTDRFDLPLQIVHKTIPDSFVYEDVRNNESFSLDDFLLTDRITGFDLENGVPVRLSVFRTEEDTYNFVWSKHHIIIDGWCSSIIVNEFYETYYNLAQGILPEPDKQHLYSDYIKWLSVQDKEAELSYWKEYLSDYIINSERRMQIANTPDAYEEKEAYLNTGINLAGKVKELCNQLGITENVLLQTIWGLLLGKWHDTDDIVFGAIVSGRPESLAGVEDILGAFINTVPVRIKYDHSALSDFLKKVHRQNIASTMYHHANLENVEKHCGYDQSVVDHIFVFENYPVQKLVEEKIKKEQFSERIEIQSTDLFELNRYPLSLVIYSSDTIFIKFKYKSSVRPELISLFIEYFEKALNAVVDNPSLTADEYNCFYDFKKVADAIITGD